VIPHFLTIPQFHVIPYFLVIPTSTRRNALTRRREGGNPGLPVIYMDTRSFISHKGNDVALFVLALDGHFQSVALNNFS
jgi:hypothetical protein